MHGKAVSSAPDDRQCAELPRSDITFCRLLRGCFPSSPFSPFSFSFLRACPPCLQRVFSVEAEAKSEQSHAESTGAVTSLSGGLRCDCGQQRREMPWHRGQRRSGHLSSWNVDIWGGTTLIMEKDDADARGHRMLRFIPPSIHPYGKTVCRLGL